MPADSPAIVTLHAQSKLPTIYDMVVRQILVSEGETVDADTLLMIVEFNKIVIEVRSPSRGIVRRIHVRHLDEVQREDGLIDFEPLTEA
ncbi:MAG: hypothetical protein CMM50_16795 [Rhodospirillaceae bacterium]|mgnify:CR=1 FL=1|nr:hypothetical protein [Rhodospirillaceae bacterium]